MMRMRESAENYLEVILMLSQKKSHVRAADICAFLGYSRPTVSAALKQLRENGYISVDADNYITLEPKGLAIAESMYERHHVIAQFFMAIGVDEETALKDSCRVEHYISKKTFDCMKAHFASYVKDKEEKK